MEAAGRRHGSGVRACLYGEREPGCGFGGSGLSLRGTGTWLRVRGFGHVSTVRLSLLCGVRSPLRSSALAPLSLRQVPVPLRSSALAPLSLRQVPVPLRSSALAPLSMPPPRCFHFGVVTEWQTGRLAVNH